MKFKMTKLLVAISALLAFASCANQTDEPNAVQPTDEGDVFQLMVKYNGEVYDVNATVDGDSLVFLDEEFENLYRTEIATNPNLAQLSYKADNGKDVIAYFSSEDELLKESGISMYNAPEQEPIMSRGGESNPVDPNTVGRACLYDDKTFKDRDITFDITKDLLVAVPNLKNYDNFNDKTSSIRVFNFLKPNVKYYPARPGEISYGIEEQAEYGSALRTCLIGYENTNYGGKILYCVSRECRAIDMSMSLEDMKLVYHCDWRLSKIGWNDKISSLAFRIIRLADVNGPIITPHVDF